MATRYIPGQRTDESSGYLAAVTPHDTNELAHTTMALWVGGAGNVSVVDAKGNTVTITGVAAGTRLPISVNKVRATGTTATNIVALY